MKRLRLGFLASHGGSNMQAIIDAVRRRELSADPMVVISNNSTSTALKRAQKERIDAFHLSDQTHASPDELDSTMLRIMQDYEVDLVILAGYMKKIGPKLLKAYQGRILNIHPALLPKFGGQGMYGKRVHQAVLDAGEQETGVTIHLIDEVYDNGPILAQEKVPVNDGDTVDTLAERVLKTEHKLYAATISKIVSGDIKLPD